MLLMMQITGTRPLCLQTSGIIRFKLSLGGFLKVIQPSTYNSIYFYSFFPNWFRFSRQRILWLRLFGQCECKHMKALGFIAEIFLEHIFLTLYWFKIQNKDPLKAHKFFYVIFYRNEWYQSIPWGRFRRIAAPITTEKKHLFHRRFAACFFFHKISRKWSACLATRQKKYEYH